MMKTMKREIQAVEEFNFGGWKETDVSATLRNSGGSIGGGSEVLVIEIFRDDSGSSDSEI